jgi:sec-independent protein translocase protein TatC
MEEEKKLTVLGHLEEVRGRLFKSLIAIVVCIVICFPLARYIYPILTTPLPGIELYFTEVTGLLGSYMKVSLYGGLVLAGPYLLYQFVMFIKPALTRREKGYFYTLLPGVLVLFFAGVMFGYFILLPPALNFLYNSFPSFVGGDINPIWTVDNYVSVVTRLLFWLGVVFEIPILMYFLARIGVISPAWIRRKWRYAVVIAFIIGGIITPTFDPVNQSLVAGPIVLLYGLGYLLAKLAWAARNKAESKTI